MLPWLFKKQIYIFSNLTCFSQNLFPESVPCYNQVSFKASAGEANVAIVHFMAKTTYPLETHHKISVAVTPFLTFTPVQLLHSFGAFK